MGKIFQFSLKLADWEGGYCLNLNQSVQCFGAKKKLNTLELHFEAKIALNVLLNSLNPRTNFL